MDGKLRHIQNIIAQSYPPVTSGQKNRVQDLMEEWSMAQKTWQTIQVEHVQPFNKTILEKAIPIIELKDFSETKRT